MKLNIWTVLLILCQKSETIQSLSSNDDQESLITMFRQLQPLERGEFFSEQLGEALQSKDISSVEGLVRVSDLVLDGMSNNLLGQIGTALAAEGAVAVDAFIDFVLRLPFTGYPQVVTRYFRDLAALPAGVAYLPLAKLTKAFPLLLGSRFEKWQAKQDLINNNVNVKDSLGQDRNVCLSAVEAQLAHEALFRQPDFDTGLVKGRLAKIVMQQMHLNPHQILQLGYWRTALAVFLASEPNPQTLNDFVKVLLDYPLALSHLYALHVADVPRYQLRLSATPVGQAMAYLLRELSTLEAPIPVCQTTREGKTTVIAGRLFGVMKAEWGKQLKWRQQKEIMEALFTWLTFRTNDELVPVYGSHLTHQSPAAYFNALVRGFCARRKEHLYPGIYIDEFNQLQSSLEQ